MRERLIKTKKGYIKGYSLKLGKKNLIILKGKKGYVACGYLDIKVADKFSEVAAKITGVSNITQALKATIKEVSKEARKMGIREGDLVKETLPLIA